jgi:hypothetical protein
MMRAQFLWKIYFPLCIIMEKIKKMFHHSSSNLLPEVEGVWGGWVGWGLAEAMRFRKSAS